MKNVDVGKQMSLVAGLAGSSICLFVVFVRSNFAATHNAAVACASIAMVLFSGIGLGALLKQLQKEKNEQAS